MKKCHIFLVNMTALTVMIAMVATGCKKDNDDSETVADIDGNVYRTVVIGDQVWFGENLKTTRYEDGDPIPETTGETEWLNLTGGAYCKFENDPANVGVYGLLYNWYAVQDSRNVCPAGWHVPTYGDWTALVDFLEGESEAGGILKEKGTSHWKSPNTGATDDYGFTALPSGYRSGGMFREPGYYAVFWSATEADATDGHMLDLISSSSQAYLEEAFKIDGYSVRCIKD
jgi:uncharacterized protein (TIGR02145 family)